MSESEILAEIVKKLCSIFEVHRVVLFGSRVRGEARSDSDYDLLVEVESNRSFQERQTLGLRALGRRAYGVDLLVLTPGEVLEGAKVLGSAIDWALTEGRTVYAR